MKTQSKETHAQIGLEIHGYLDTKEKLFCTCKNFHDMKQISPNTNICPICTGQPGSKPMLANESAVKKAIEIGLMLGCKPIFKPLSFQRKHYDWPEICPKGYQITMSGSHSQPTLENGKFLGIRIREIHLEEDPAAWNPETGTIDYNRSGAPLIEIVTEPDFKSPEQVKDWLKQLVLTLSYIKAINKDAGTKADVNVSIKNLSERTEVKNVNSIVEIAKAIEFEISRHLSEKPSTKETRRWDAIKQKTEKMREKEQAQDYRFIPDPDLPALKLTKQYVSEIQKQLPESPQAKLEKIIKKHKIPKQHAEVLTSDLGIAQLFEKVIEKINPKFALHWITTELKGILNYNKKTLDEVDINPVHVIELLNEHEKGNLTKLKTQEILRKFIPKSFSPKEHIKSSNASVISDKSEIETIINKIIKENSKPVEDYKSGNKNSINFLIGKVMQATNKRADFQLVKKILENKLK